MPEPGATGSGVGAGMAGGGSGIGAGEAEGPGIGGGHGQDVFEGYDLAGALADALNAGYAGGDYYDPGAVAAQDEAAQGGYSPGEQERMDAAAAAAAQAERDALAQRMAELDVAIAASTDAGSAGPGTLDSILNVSAAPAFVDDFSSGGYATAGNQAGGMETFGYDPQAMQRSAVAARNAQMSGGFSSDVFDPTSTASMGWQDTMATEEGDAGIPGEFAFVDTSRPAYGTQGYSTSVGTGVEDFANMPGYGTMATEESDYAETGMMPGTPYDAGEFTGTPTVEQSQMGMAAPMGSGAMSPNVGMLTATSGPYGDPAGRVATPGAGMITAGTVDPGGMTGAESVLGTAGTTSPDFWANADEQAVMSQKYTSAVKKANTPEANTAAHKNLAQQRLDWGKMLEEKAKADPNGRVLDKFGNKTTVTNRQLANAYNGFDSTLEAYAVINGASKLGSFIASVVPGSSIIGGLLGGIKDFLVSKGIYDKTSPQDISSMIQEALVSGEPLTGGGPTQEEMGVTEFIKKYPWAKGLDPRYIQHLIDNPAEVQSLVSGDAELSNFPGQIGTGTFADDVIHTDMDGFQQSGIVWKPISEADSNLVILTPPGFDSANVLIENEAGDILDTGSNMGRTNGNRFTYRFSMPGAQYEGPIYLRVGNTRYKIDDPGARVN